MSIGFVSLSRVEKHIDKIQARKRKREWRKRNGPSEKRSYKNLRKDERGIIAVDGEGESDPDGKHRYTLLASSDGRYHRKIAAHDLSTQECLQFLTRLPADKLVVGFSFGYDVNMILRDVPRWNGETCNGACCLFDLQRGRPIFFDRFRLEYIPRKKFTIADVSVENDKRAQRTHANRKYKYSCVVYDVFGYFQTSFVKSLDQHDIGTPEERALIAEMKSKRGEFSEELAREYERYCFLECDLLIKMYRKVLDSLDYLDIHQSQHMGAGSIASALLKKYEIKNYLKDVPAEYDEAFLSAYYGGRFEVRATGEFSNVHTYDINSAYPYMISKLPCLKHARYYQTKWFDPFVEFGVWYVKWNIDDSEAWCPFPFRIRGRIAYPRQGEGWYHASEVLAAWKHYGNQIEIQKGIVLQRGCQHTPFDWIPELFEFRAKLKAEGNYAQYTLKLGYNSVYGKMAQRIGWHGSKPTYQSYAWAGMVTAGTRAMLLEAMHLNPEAIVSDATDGIVSTKPLDLDTGKKLGQWEYDKYGFAFIVMNGVYVQAKTHDDFRSLLVASRDNDSETIAAAIKSGQLCIKSRGLSLSELSWYHVYRNWGVDPIRGSFKFSVRRFIGFGLALMLTEENFYTHWRRWIETERVIKFALTFRMPYPEDIQILIEAFTARKRVRRIRYHPIGLEHPVFKGQTISTSYTRAKGWRENGDMEFLKDFDESQALAAEQPG